MIPATILATTGQAIVCLFAVWLGAPKVEEQSNETKNERA